MSLNAPFARAAAIAAFAGIALVGIAPPAAAQYFGQNKVQYDRFDFRVLETDHFDIYYYPEEADIASEAGRMAERWYSRLSELFDHELLGRQPLVLYASHPDFEQTNVIEGPISEGTGGVTESFQRRIVLPMGASLESSNHVIGHELVHAFQYDMLGPAIQMAPLWFIEGMAEYYSLGTTDVQTAMWLRDAALHDELPDLEDLSNPRYFPYRFGHAFWAFIAQRWSDATIRDIVYSLAASGVPGRGGPRGAIEAIETETSLDREALSAAWHEAIRTAYNIEPIGNREEIAPDSLVIGERTGSGTVNVGPSLSPDGRRIAFLSERGGLSIDVFLADAETGAIIRKLTETAADPHFESLQFLASAGTWSPDGRQLAVATVRGGRPVLAIFDAENGGVDREIRFADLGEIFQPAWSPDGTTIAFAAQLGGVTDLFTVDLATGERRRLTTDAFADLQPAWSPDGREIVFVTERFTTDLATLAIGDARLAIINVADGTIRPVDTGLDAQTVNPQYSADGTSLFFVSDATGRQDAYRFDLPAGPAVPMTGAITGVSGITPISPALSVAANRAALSLFREGGYEIHVIPAESTADDAAATNRADARLPPPRPQPTEVARLLAEPEAGLPDAEEFDDEPYEPHLQLVAAGQQIGVGTSSQFGTYLSGGISLTFSDVLGEHLLGTTFDVNGSVKDIGASVMYVNRTSRWNWGLFGERVPLLSGSARSGFADVDGQTYYIEETDLFRQTYHQLGALIAYPFSRATRIEFTGAGRHIGFSREVETLYYDPFTGNFLDRQVQQLDSADSLLLADFSAAVIRDTAAFGATSPILGDRMRLEVQPTVGDLRYTNVTLDYRRYVMPIRPFTFAGRALHIGRYGGSGEDERLLPLFLGYPSLVRGYDAGTFRPVECTVVPGGGCPEFDQLIGSRLLVFNGEVRAPLVGAFTGDLEYGGIPVEIFAFGDAGLAWTASEESVLTGGPRDWVTSVGFGARANAFGFAIVELNVAKPIQRPEQGWMFVFNFRPGF